MEEHTFPIPEEQARELDRIKDELPAGPGAGKNQMRTAQMRSGGGKAVMLGALALGGLVWLMRR
jgi:hypothetical protein